MCAAVAVLVAGIGFLSEKDKTGPEKPIASSSSPKNEPEKINADGVLTVALSPDFSPMEFVDSSKSGQDQYVGFDVSLAKYLAEELGVRIAIENCPMLSGRDQWPGGQNLMTTPAIWRKVFEILPSPNLGINYDPSHFVWQMIDYIRPLYEFKDKIFHVHYKDIKLYPDKLNDVGIMAYPLDFMSPKLPGLGDVDWGKYVSALTDIGYDGFTCVEVEDRAFEGSREKVLDSLRLSKRYMEQFVI